MLIEFIEMFLIYTFIWIIKLPTCTTQLTDPIVGKG